MASVDHLVSRPQEEESMCGPECLPALPRRRDNRILVVPTITSLLVCAGVAAITNYDVCMSHHAPKTPGWTEAFQTEQPLGEGMFVLSMPMVPHNTSLICGRL